MRRNPQENFEISLIMMGKREIKIEKYSGVGSTME